jgi:hypothetical protein
VTEEIEFRCDGKSALSRTVELDCRHLLEHVRELHSVDESYRERKGGRERERVALAKGERERQRE